MKYINDSIDSHLRVIESIRLMNSRIYFVSNMCADVLANGNKIIFCGNGGSASDSQHLAGELVGRLKGERRSLPALALGADSAVMSCIANDYGYDQVFARQVDGLGKKGDVLVGISTSGKSRNVVLAVQAAKKLGIHTVGLLGGSGGELMELCDHTLCISASTDTARIQEAHIFVGHCICALIERKLGLVS
jgi:D-sedoheptulose 7-phosphate isomerase